eukprot:3299509-Amphidinium_carterae.1
MLNFNLTEEVEEEENETVAKKSDAKGVDVFAVCTACFAGVPDVVSAGRKAGSDASKVARAHPPP